MLVEDGVEVVVIVPCGRNQSAQAEGTEMTLVFLPGSLLPSSLLLTLLVTLDRGSVTASGSLPAAGPGQIPVTASQHLAPLLWGTRHSWDLVLGLCVYLVLWLFG